MDKNRKTTNTISLIKDLEEQHLFESQNDYTIQYDLQTHNRNLHMLRTSQTTISCEISYWICQKCSFPYNMTHNITCKMCKSAFDGIKSNSSSNMIQKAKPRRKSKQRLLNEPIMVNLFSDRDDDVTNDFEVWQCAVCTFENTKSIVKCVMCFYMRDPIHNVPVGKTLQLTAEQIASNHREYIISYCKEKNQLYTDSEFPPELSSLYYNPNNVKNNVVYKWKRLRFVTLDNCDTEFSWSIFQPRLHPSDVYQGELKDCWFLSALAVLTEREDLIRKLILNIDLCKQGVYQVQLCKNGQWVIVSLDDLFPCDKEGRLVYAQTIRRQLWVPLIEKAAAKLYGCYQSLNNNYSIEGLSILTGAPCETLVLQSPHGNKIDTEIIWSKLMSYQQNFFMAATCGMNNVDYEEYYKMGLSTRHCYSLLTVREIDQHRLLQLKNPWGHFVWKGDWSDDSPKWTPMMRSVLQPKYSTEGIFWMSFGDFLKHFDVVDICKIRRDWNEMRLSGLLPFLLSEQNLPCIQIDVLETTEIDFVLYQDDQREVPCSQRRYTDLSIIVFKSQCCKSVKVHEVVSYSERKVESFVTCNQILSPGKYIVLSLTFNHLQMKSKDLNNYYNYTLAIHSCKRLLAEQLTVPFTILTDVIISLVVNYGSVFDCYDNVTVRILDDWTGSIIVIDNLHQTEWLHVECDCSGSCNVTSTRGNLRTLDSIPPACRQICMMLMQVNRKDHWDVSHNIEYKFSSSSKLYGWADVQEGLHFPELDFQTEYLYASRSIFIK